MAAAPSRRGVLVSLLLPIYLPAGLSTTAQTLLVPFLPLWLPGSIVKVPLWQGPSSPPAPLLRSRCGGSRGGVHASSGGGQLTGCPGLELARRLESSRRGLGASDAVVGAFFSVQGLGAMLAGPPSGEIIALLVGLLARFRVS